MDPAQKLTNRLVAGSNDRVRCSGRIDSEQRKIWYVRIQNLTAMRPLLSAKNSNIVVDDVIVVNLKNITGASPG
jgi:hypothetical protein